MNDFKSYVGPIENYDRSSSMQFNLLTLAGLRSDHKLLDIGCGSLRAGKLFISYLDKGKYFGVEPNKWLVRESIKNEVGKDLIKIKSPVFLYNSKFDFSKLKTEFDFAVAQSIFSHTSKSQLESCLRNISNILNPKTGKFFATFYISDADYKGATWVYPECVEFRLSTIKKLAGKYGLNVMVLDWPHPNGQTWAAITKVDVAKFEDPAKIDISRLYIEGFVVKNLKDSTTSGNWDSLRKVGEVYLANGWAKKESKNHPSTHVIIVDHKNRIIATSTVNKKRKDVAEYFNDNELLLSGWEANFKTNFLKNHQNKLTAYSFSPDMGTGCKLIGEFEVKQ